MKMKTGMDANPGSKQVTHKTMEPKSNVKGVSEVSSKFSNPQKGEDKSRVMKGDISKEGMVKL